MFASPEACEWSGIPAQGDNLLARLPRRFSSGNGLFPPWQRRSAAVLVRRTWWYASAHVLDLLPKQKILVSELKNGYPSGCFASRRTGFRSHHGCGAAGVLHPSSSLPSV